MKVIEVANQIEGGQVAFDLLKEKLEQGAKTLGLATGSSPLEFYKLIRESDLDFSDMVSVNLDEYVGLTGEDPQSYRYFMQENLFNEKPFKVSYLPKGNEDTAEEETAHYNEILAQHPVDLQILGSVATDTLVLTNQARHLTAKRIWSIWINQRLKPTLASLKKLKMFQPKPSPWGLRTFLLPSLSFSLPMENQKQKRLQEWSMVQKQRVYQRVPFKVIQML